MWANLAILLGVTVAIVAPGVFAMRRVRPRWPRAARVIEALLIAVLSLFAGAATAEALAKRLVDIPASLRQQGYVEYQPGRLGLRPNATLTWHTLNPDWKRFRVETNADGLRTRVAPDTRPAPHERRVIFYGDSFTLGVGLDAHETYPAQAETLLNEGSRARWVTINAGVHGYNFFSAIDLFEWSADHYQPAVVVFTVHEEDDLRPDLNDDPRKRAVGPFASLHRFALYRYLRAGTVHFRDRYDDTSRSDRRNTGVGSGLLWHARRDRMASQVARVRALADRFNCEVIVHVLTHHDVFEPTPFQAFAQADMQVVVTRWVQDDPARTIPRDGHPNAEGARYLASTVIPAIRAVIP
jgi:hypothetical protein